MVIRKDRGTYSFLYSYLRPYWLDIAISLVCVVIAAASILGLGGGIRYFINSNSNDFWLELYIFFSGFAILICLSVFGRVYFINRGGQRAIGDMRKDLNSYLMFCPPIFFEHWRSGNLVSIITSDISVLENFIAGSATLMFRHLLTTIGSMGMIFYSNFELALDVLLLIPMLALIKIFVGNKVRKLSEDCRAEIGNLGSHIEDYISSIKLIQSFSWEDAVIKRFNVCADKCSNTFIRYSLFRAVFIVSIFLAMLLVVFFVLWTGLNKLTLNLVDTGTLISFLFYVLAAAGGFSGISDGWNDFQQSNAALSRVIALINDHKHGFAMEVPSFGDPIVPELKSIEFIGVNFSYPSRQDIPVLRDFCLDIKAGETVAFVGPSGAGKSTVFSLLMGFYDTYSGSIRINDIDIKSFACHNVRKVFAWVPQDSILFADSVLMNLCFGHEEIDEMRVKEVLDHVGLLDFIQSLPHGLHTVISEKGSNFSGGQKQRMGVARALLKDSPVLLFDEITSALDSESEAVIQNALFDIYDNKIKLIIAHRLSTILRSDRIVVVDRGMVVEVGTHTELLDNGGIYSKMAKASLIRD